MTTFIDPTLVDGASTSRFPPLSSAAASSASLTSSYAPLSSRSSLASHRYNPYGGKPRSSSSSRPNGLVNGLREEVQPSASIGRQLDGVSSNSSVDGVGGGSSGKGWLGSLTGLLGAVVKPFIWTPAPSATSAKSSTPASNQSSAVPCRRECAIVQLRPPASYSFILLRFFLVL